MDEKPDKLAARLYSGQKILNQIFFARFLSFMGVAPRMIFAPLYFANSIKLSSSEIGFGIGLSAIVGCLARLLGGKIVDNFQSGSRNSFIASKILYFLAALSLYSATNFLEFTLANSLLAFGIGLFWPAMETIIAELSDKEKQSKNFTLSRFTDAIGLCLGAGLSAYLITIGYGIELLLIGDAFVNLLFLIAAIKVPKRERALSAKEKLSVFTTLKDKGFRRFCISDIIFTAFIAQTPISLPLFFNEAFGINDSLKENAFFYSAFFISHFALNTALQIPVGKWIRGRELKRSLMDSSLFFLVAFGSLAFYNDSSWTGYLSLFISMACLSLATTLYLPASSELVSKISRGRAPGTFFAIHSICWSLGFVVGPIFGGFLIEKQTSGLFLWISLVIIAIINIAILKSIELDSKE